MTRRSLPVFSAIGAMLFFTGCAQYATVRETRPRFSPMSPKNDRLLSVDKGIVQEQSYAGKKPLSVLASYLTCAETAAQELQRDPNDECARRCYNYSLARIVATM